MVGAHGKRNEHVCVQMQVSQGDVIIYALCYLFSEISWENIPEVPGTEIEIIIYLIIR